MLQWLDQVGAEAGCSMQTQLAARAWALSSAGAGVQPHATITDLPPHPAPQLQEIDDLRKWVNSLDKVDSQGHSRRPAPCNAAATATLLPMLCLAPGSAALNVPGSCCCQLWDVSFLTVTYAVHLFAGWWTLRRKLRGEGTAHHISSTVAAVAEG